MKYSCPVISRQTLLSDEGALSLATSGQRRMAVSTDCLTQSTVVICPDTEIILINQRCRPFTNTPDISGIDLNNHQHHKFFKALAHLEKHLMHLSYRLTSNVGLLACVSSLFSQACFVLIVSLLSPYFQMHLVRIVRSTSAASFWLFWCFRICPHLISN